jgi:hypothetical protein
LLRRIKGAQGRTNVPVRRLANRSQQGRATEIGGGGLCTYRRRNVLKPLGRYFVMQLREHLAAFASLALLAGVSACAPHHHGHHGSPHGGHDAHRAKMAGHHPHGGHASAHNRHWRRTQVDGVVWVWHPHRACWLRDNDQNPPGQRGGPGTNWENPPGPIGGPGASPDRRACS